MKFTKMHGLGNDYVVINGLNEQHNNWPFLAKKISQKHFGVGADGLVLILPSQKADFRMRIFKADGMESEMCGNAIRCVAKYVYENKLTDKTHLYIETVAGVKELFLHTENNLVHTVQVNMGMPEIEPSACIFLPDNRELFGQVVNLGNPHFVVPVASVSDYPVARMGQIIERNPYFPHRTDVEFVEIRDRSHIKVRVWERGSGETYSCGSGACAAAMAGIDQGFLAETVDVELLGGHLQIVYDSFYQIVQVIGAAETVFTGELSTSFLTY